jgi:hypothetical protein
MRRVLAPLAAAALATTTLAGTVVAAPSQHVRDSQIVVACDGLSGPDGTAYAVAAVSETFGTFGEIGFWEPGADQTIDPPTWIGIATFVEGTTSSMEAQYQVFEYVIPDDPEGSPIGDEVGNATLSATLTPDGPAEDYRFRDPQGGNQKYREVGTQQAYSVDGSLDLPEGISFDLGTCEAFSITFTAFQNAPASRVVSVSDFQVNCVWELEEDVVFLFAAGEGDTAFIDLNIFGASGEVFGSLIEGSLTESSLDASWDLYRFGIGEPELIGDASASAALAETNERINDRFRDGNFKYHATGQIYSVDGTLELGLPSGDVSLAMDAEHCFAADLHIVEQESARQGPRGKPIANDAPDAAAPIAVGETVTISTAGADPIPEAPCTITVEEETFDVPISYTGWWTFTGTGGPVTVDTTGSDFDTVVGVYVDDGGVLTQVGCVDDVPESLQAVITVDTEAGVTYYVQAGGFGDQRGTLVLSVY